MSLLGAMLGVRARKAVDVSALTWEKLLGEPASKSGQTVSIDRALGVSVVFGCARAIAEGLAQMPLKLYREKDRGKEPARTHALYRLLAVQPNEWMTSFELVEALTLHTVLTGNGFAFINRVRGTVRELIPLVPNLVTVRRGPDYTLSYDVRDSAGGSITIPRENMLHLRGPSWNTYVGLDIVQQAREAIGLAMATEESHARLFSNGAQPGGILSTDVQLGDKAIERLKEQWRATFEGTANRFKTAVLDNGFKFHPLSMNGVDAQHLETRKHQIEDICRAFRVFPLMVMHADKTSTFASSEQFFLAHVVHTLEPWVRRWEMAIQRDLIGAAEEGFFAKFSMQSLLRGDHKTRAAFYGAGIKDGWLTRNEAREREDLDPLDGLDEPLRPLNMGPGNEPPPEDDGDEPKPDEREGD